MSEQTLDLVQAIRERLRAAVRRITLADFLFGLVLTLGVVAALWLVSAAVEAGFWLGVTPRTVFFWGFLAVVAGLAGTFLVLPLLRLAGVLRGPSEEAVARRIGARYPEVSDRLVNLLHLVEGRRSEAPAPLIDGAVRMLGEQVRPVPFEKVEDFNRARRAGRLASLPLAGLLLFLLAAPSVFLSASQRLFSPGETFQRPAPFRLDVRPGSVELVKGAALEITVRATGRELPRAVVLAVNHLDEDLVEEVRLLADSTGLFRHTLVNVRKPLRYRVSAAPVQTTWYTAAVTERPIVRSLQVSLTFPAYTGIPPQRLVPNVGDVTALPGTRVGVEVVAGGRDVADAFLRFDDGSLDTLSLDGDRAEGAFVLRREGAYQVVLRNAGGVENSEPITYTLKLLADAFPAVVLLEPEPLAELDETLRADLRLRLNDDFGFSGLRLFYRLAESRFGAVSPAFEALDLPLDAPRQLDQEIAYPWLLKTTGLDLVPGDVVEYFVEVRDNDAFAGFKPARSATHRLRMPSLAEQYEQIDQQQEQAEGEMEDLLRETDKIREQFKELRDELRRKQEGDWEDKRQLEGLQQQQQNLEERVNDLSSQIESVTEKMQENNLVDEETLQMYQELERVAQEINSPELMEALRQLQEAMEQLNLQQMQESIQNFEFNAEQYRQRLERTLDLFKRLQVQQKLDEAARRAEELARQEERLAEETGKLREETDEPPQDAKDDEQREGDREGDRKDGEPKQNEPQDADPKDGEPKDGDPKDADQKDGTPKDGDQKDGRQNEGDRQQRAEELAREQELSSQEMKELEKQLEELLEKMKELRNTPQEQMERLNEQTQQQQMPQQMQQNAEQLRQQQMQDAQQGQQQMQQQLQQMQQQLQQMQQGMQSQQMQINMAGMRRALSDILTLSQQQEALRTNVEAVPSDSPRLREMAQRQVELSEGLRVVSDTLQSLSREIPQMTREVQQQAGDAQRAMSEATEALAERANRQAGGQQKTSMMHLNELALLLSDLLDQMMNAQAGTGSGMSMQQMIQQLQDMAGQQEQLNQQIQQMLNDMQGNRLSQDAQERLRQMAAQQEALRRQLKELSRNRELNSKALGDLNKIAEQMEETIQELQRQRVDRQTVQRQQQILTRLLDAARSIRERGKDKKRESRSADDVLRQSPGALTPAQQADELRRALLRALESGYAPDYEELIKRYFELLQQQPQDQR